jgi:Protein of unknown function (DUF2783)
MPLIRTANIPDPDGFYEELVAGQRELDEAQAQRYLAKLVLILANQVGDRACLREAIALARENTLAAASGSQGAHQACG